jgi:alpha-beta hydrolase superfamily lysophospholipase
VPLIWAHGSASTGYEIRSVAPRLVAAGCRVIAVDYRGHGLTRVADYEPDSGGAWGFLPGFERMMRSIARYNAGATKPSTMPMLQWSQHALIPMATFRNLSVPMMILDPRS